MKFDAIWPRHIPKGLTLSREEYRSVKREAKYMRQREWKRQLWHSWRVFLPVAPVFAILFYLHFTDHSRLSAILFLIVYPALMVYVFYTVRLTDQPFIRRALCKAGHEVCIDCGYLLRGLPDDVVQCPECGAIRVNKPRAAREFVAREPLPESVFTADTDEPNADDYKPLPKYRWD